MDSTKSLQRVKSIADIEIGQMGNTARNSEDSSQVDHLQKGSTPRMQYRNVGVINGNYDKRTHSTETRARPTEQELVEIHVSKSQVTYKNGASRDIRRHYPKE